MAKAAYRYIISSILGVSATPLLAADYEVYLTAAVDQGVPLAQPATEFGCSDAIYAVAELRGLPKTQHTLDAVWRDPQGTERERTSFPFFVRADRERVWVWLKLHRSPEAALIQFVDPGAGMGEFIGTWEVQLFVDGESISKETFSVLC